MDGVRRGVARHLVVGVLEAEPSAADPARPRGHGERAVVVVVDLGGDEEVEAVDLQPLEAAAVLLVEDGPRRAGVEVDQLSRGAR